MRRLPLIAAAIIMPSCAVIIAMASMNLAGARSSHTKTRDDVMYACAYLAGQYAIMNRLPELFPETRDTPVYCKKFEAGKGVN